MTTTAAQRRTAKTKGMQNQQLATRGPTASPYKQRIRNGAAA